MSEGPQTACRGIRGAITVDGDDPALIRQATLRLLEAIMSTNGCRTDDLAAATFVRVLGSYPRWRG